MKKFSYRIYPAIGVARVGNGPVHKNVVTFTPETPWENLFDTNIEHRTHETDIKKIINDRVVEDLVATLNKNLPLEQDLVIQFFLASNISRYITLEEIKDLVYNLCYDVTKRVTIEQLRGVLVEILKTKYLGSIKKQAQRFAIYKYDNSTNLPVEKIKIENVEDIEWNVDVANKKSLWYDFNNSLDLSLNEENGNLSSSIYKHKLSPALVAKRRNPNIVDQKIRKKLSSRSKGSVSLKGRYFKNLEGHFPNNIGDSITVDNIIACERHVVKHGSIEIDDDGSLLFYAGDGISKALDPSTPNTDFADNSNWYDDICDGKISATLKLKGSLEAIELTSAEEGAWITTAPPDYAPQIEPLVTMYDMAAGASYSRNDLENLKTSFSDVFFILYRMYRMQWVNATDFSDNILNKAMESIDVKKLMDNDSKNRDLRKKIFDMFRNPSFTDERDVRVDASGVYINRSPIPANDTTDVRNVKAESNTRLPYYPNDGVDYPGSPMQWFAIPPFMYRHLENWSEGNFTVSSQEIDNASSIDDLGLYYSKVFSKCKNKALLSTRAALDTLYGGGFHPGVELTWPMRRQQIYKYNEYKGGVSLDNHLLGLREIRLNQAEDDLCMYNDFGYTISSDDIAQSIKPNSKKSWLWSITPGDLTKWMGIPWQSDGASCQTVFSGTGFPVPSWWAATLPVDVIPFAKFNTFKNEESARNYIDSRLSDDFKKNEINLVRREQYSFRQPWLHTADTGFVGYHAKAGYVQGLIKMVEQWKNLGIVMARKVESNTAGLPETVYVSYTPENYK